MRLGEPIGVTERTAGRQFEDDLAIGVGVGPELQECGVGGLGVLADRVEVFEILAQFVEFEEVFVGRRVGSRLVAHSPMSSFHNSGWEAMKSSISATQSESSTTTTSTPRERSRSSPPMNVRFSPTTTRGMP